MNSINAIGDVTLFFNPGETAVDLESIRSAKGDIREIRMLLKGNLPLCLKLFKEAVEQGDVISQIQLSHVRFGIKWDKDEEKDFSTLTSKDLKEFSYYPREFSLFNSTYDEAMGVEFDYKVHDARGFETFRLAEERGYLPATLELLDKDWGYNISTFGYAAALRPYAGKGDKVIDFCFGRALKNSTQIGTKDYYEGMHWMEQSLGITVKYPREGQDFDAFKSQYIRIEDCSNTFYDYDGLRHVGSAKILAPNENAWRTFVREKLTNVTLAAEETYQIKHDTKQIAAVIKQNNLRFVHCSEFIRHPIKGRVIIGLGGKEVHGFRIDSLSVYAEEAKRLGEISVEEDTFEIYQTIKDPKLTVVVDFIESVMKRTGSAGSAYSWMRHMTDWNYKSNL